MATSGKPVDEQTRREVERLRAAGLSIRETARQQFLSPTTIQKILKKSPCKVSQS